MPTDRNRASGRVPDRCGICQFVPLDHRLPDLQLLHFPPPFLFAVLSITVPSSTHLLLRFFTKFQVLFSLLSTNIPSTSSPFLLFHLFISIFFFYISLFLPFFFVPISFRASSKDFFLYTPQIFLPVGAQKITEILRSPLSVLIRAFVPAATPRENPAFFNEIP